MEAGSLGTAVVAVVELAAVVVGAAVVPVVPLVLLLLPHAAALIATNTRTARAAHPVNLRFPLMLFPLICPPEAQMDLLSCAFCTKVTIVTRQ
jgi:hypothetical protein